MRTKNNPKTRTYDGIAAAAGALGIDSAIIRWAKKQGAPGFRNGRVDASKLIPWLGTHQPTTDGPAVTKEQAILHRVLEQVRDLRRKNDEKEGKLVPVAWVAERMGAACSEFIRLRQLEKDGWSAKLAAVHGVTVAAARTLHDEATEDIGKILRSLSSVFGDSNQPKP
jgi:hypothetical protein